jgi:hypothetical protein
MTEHEATGERTVTDAESSVEAEPAVEAAPAVESAPAIEAELASTLEPEMLRWTRVMATAIAISLLHGLIVFGVIPFISGRPAAAAIALGALPYLLVGVAAGFLRGGQSLLETFYGALIPAALFSALYELGRVFSTDPANVGRAMEMTRWVIILVPLLSYVLIALFASWIGERRALVAERLR